MPDSLPELLCPAGNPEKLQTALTYGADAVYLGGPDLNLRSRNKGFSDLNQVIRAMQTVHAHKSAVYFCLNILAGEKHLPEARKTLERLGDNPPDALIIADPGILRMARKICPGIPIHLSTQANTANCAAIDFWQENGVRRINLAREMTLSDIKNCLGHAANMEMEIFVHGAMCMAISGRCLLSSYLNRRSANLGSCTHPCRFEYRPRLVLEEKQRPGQDTWILEEDNDFSHLLAAEDLCLVKYLPWFKKNRITSLKIEGRMKSVAYLAQVTDIYRTALDDMQNHDFRPGKYLDELQKTATRPLSSGFFLPRRKTFIHPDYRESRGIVARITSKTGSGTWQAQAKARWPLDIDLKLLLPGLQRPLLSKNDYGLENERGEKISMAHPGMDIIFRCSHPSLRPGIILCR